MTILAVLIGFALGIAASIVFNYVKPDRFDKITADAAQKIKDKL